MPPIHSSSSFQDAQLYLPDTGDYKNFLHYIRSTSVPSTFFLLLICHSYVHCGVPSMVGLCPSQVNLTTFKAVQYLYFITVYQGTSQIIQLRRLSSSCTPPQQDKNPPTIQQLTWELLNKILWTPNSSIKHNHYHFGSILSFLLPIPNKPKHSALQCHFPVPPNLPNQISTLQAMRNNSLRNSLTVI